MFEDSKVIPAGPDGLNNPPIAIEVNNNNELENAVIGLATQLTKREKIDPSDIGFITMTDERKFSQITVQEAGILKRHNFKAQGVEREKLAGVFSRGGVTYWKGLERDIIIILNVLNVDKLDMNSLYVALSRSKIQFIILAQSKEIDLLKQRIGLNPPNDMYRVKFSGIKKELENGNSLKILK